MWFRCIESLLKFYVLWNRYQMWDADDDDADGFERRLDNVVREIGERGKIMVPESVPPLHMRGPVTEPTPAQQLRWEHQCANQTTRQPDSQSRHKKKAFTRARKQTHSRLSNDQQSSIRRVWFSSFVQVANEQQVKQLT